MLGIARSPSIGKPPPVEGQAAPVDKVFVTGVYGSGKTFFAKRYAKEVGLPYIGFEDLHDYDLKENQSRKILAGLPARFVIDAIPIDENGTWTDFLDYQRANDVLVICVYCPNRDIWLERVSRKRFVGETRLWAKEMLKRALFRVRHRREMPLEIDSDLHLREYRNFFRHTLQAVDTFRRVWYYDSSRREYTTRDMMLERILFRCFPLEDHLDSLGKHHDKKYQDIEILHLVGYTESHKTWERIRDLVDWKEKRVLDLGCFHGYFCFKVEDAGGIVKGLDRSRPVLDVAAMINDLRGGRVAFREWVAGDDLPECDVILCLNVLHHFEDPEKAISKMRCRQAVFEINENNRPLVEKYFDVGRDIPSHRANRRILLCDPRVGS
jgi:hypothetical protein